MSETALRLNADGTTERVHITEVTDRNRYDKYICDGKNPWTGELCKAEMIPVIKGEKPCFRVKFKHICNCPNDESEAAVIKRHLDVTGRSTTIANLLDVFGKSTPAKECSASRTRATKSSGEKTTGEKEEIEDEREHKREARDPRNLKELCALLVKTDLQDPYAGVPVRDTIVDHRDVDEYREGGLSDGQMTVVLCKRTSKDRLNKLFPLRNPRDVVLCDAYAYDDRADPLLFVINGSRPAMQKIFKAPRDHIIAVFSRWHSHPTNPHVYICEPIEIGQFFSANASFFES